MSEKKELFEKLDIIKQKTPYTLRRLRKLLLLMVNKILLYIYPKNPNVNRFEEKNLDKIFVYIAHNVLILFIIYFFWS